MFSYIQFSFSLQKKCCKIFINLYNKAQPLNLIAFFSIRIFEIEKPKVKVPELKFQSIQEDFAIANKSVAN